MPFGELSCFDCPKMEHGCCSQLLQRKTDASHDHHLLTIYHTLAGQVKTPPGISWYFNKIRKSFDGTKLFFCLGFFCMGMSSLKSGEVT